MSQERSPSSLEPSKIEEVGTPRSDLGKTNKLVAIKPGIHSPRIKASIRTSARKGFDLNCISNKEREQSKSPSKSQKSSPIDITMTSYAIDQGLNFENCASYSPKAGEAGKM